MIFQVVCRVRPILKILTFYLQTTNCLNIDEVRLRLASRRRYCVDLRLFAFNVRSELWSDNIIEDLRK